MAEKKKIVSRKAAKKGKAASAAEKAKKVAEKNEVVRKRGRPPKYDDPDKMQEKIDAYFNECCQDEVMKDEEGNILVDTKGRPVIKYNPPTCADLAIYLGFVDRDSLYDYAKKEDFSGTIKKAITKIEAYAEKQLYIGNPTGAIFWLKNHGWKDKMQLEERVSDDEADFKTFYDEICQAGGS